MPLHVDLMQLGIVREKNDLSAQLPLTACLLAQYIP
jgi:hypothetical protein